MIEAWMESEATTAPEVAHAKEQFRIRMIKLSKFSERQVDADPVDLSNVPPHLIHRYT